MLNWFGMTPKSSQTVCAGWQSANRVQALKNLDARHHQSTGDLHASTDEKDEEDRDDNAASWTDTFDEYVLEKAHGEPSVWGSASPAAAPGSHSAYVGHRTIVASRIWSEAKTHSSVQTVEFKLPDYSKYAADSFCEVILPFGSDLRLREQYVTHYGILQFGLVLEDLDAFAWYVASKHCQDPSNPTHKPYNIVTASVNRIDLINKLKSDRDLRMRGCVTWVGRSSMTIRIQISSCRTGSYTSETQPGDWRPIIYANFTMVARDPSTNEAAVVPRLIVSSPLEQKWFDEGVEAHKLIQQSKESSVYKKPPTQEESDIIHKLYVENQETIASNSEKHFTYMGETTMQSVSFCHPQERNNHYKIFGGFLMRQAYDLAYSNAFLYTGYRPYFLAMDDISFLKPVEIGSILDFKSKVVYAPGYPSASIQVQVSAEVINPKLNTRDVTNVFHFIFACPHAQVKKLMPETYSDFMVYLEAMRRHERGRDKQVAPSLVRNY